MDIGNPDAPIICSEFINQVVNPDISNLNKKRKFPPEAFEQPGSPSSKHRCYKSAFTSDVHHFSRNRQDEEESHSQLDKARVDIEVKGDKIGINSEQASNSLVGDFHSLGSSMADSNFAKEHSCSQASTSCSTNGREAFMTNSYSIDESALNSKVGRFLYQDDGRDAMDHLLDYVLPKYGDDTEQQAVKELEEFLYSDGVNPDLYVVAAGKRSFDHQEAEVGAREPTIDQEFEQYFSMLML